MEDVRLNLKDFDKYTKKMKQDVDKHFAKVGVLSKKDARKGDDDIGNAELASIHEFGSLAANIPPRSFLQLTREERGEEMADFIASQAENITKKVMAGKTQEVLKKIAAKWMSYIHECFETEGFGTWLSLKDSTLAGRRAKTPKKKRESGDFDPQILQDTGQLERSITYEVK